MSAILRTTSLLLVALWSAVIVAAAGCTGSEPADPVAPQGAAQPADPAPPAGRSVTPMPRQVAKAADTPLPARPASAPQALGVGDAAGLSFSRRPSRPRPPGFGPDYHHTQVVTAVGQMRDTMAPWRDTGANRLFSAHVFGTPFMLNENGEVRPWIATRIAFDDYPTVWTMKLREDAVFQDGTPITAADFKAYWEHGAKPGNIAAWGGASLTLGRIRGWEELMAGEVAEAEGLRVVDDHTLEIETVAFVALPLYMTAWHVGISKLDQVKSDENWGNAPIGAGPFGLTYDPDTGLTELTRFDIAGKHWTAYRLPHIWKLVLPNIPDARVGLVMFENGELDLMTIDRATFQAAHDPAHPFNPLVYVSPYGGLSAILPNTDVVPLEDLMFRRALAHGQDMEKIVKIVWGSTAVHARGLISSLVPCHHPDANHQMYDPDLARQYLSESTYGGADNRMPLTIDLSRPDMVGLGILMKGYWRHNLGVDLEIRERAIGAAKRAAPHLRDRGLDSWLPDPAQIVVNLIWTKVRNFPDGHSVLAAWAEYALSLPLDHPDRCQAFHAVEREYLENVNMIPIREADTVRWVVQPWLIGFESTFNQDFNTLTTAYVASH